MQACRTTSKARGHFVSAFWQTAKVAVVSIILINLFAFAVAYALTRGIRGANLFRSVFFMPNLIGGIVLGYIWNTIFAGVLRGYNTALNSTWVSGASSSCTVRSRWVT